MATDNDGRYGADHRRLRAKWAPQVAAGGVRCHSSQCVNPWGPLIRADAAWDLGHTTDGTAWTGPEHAKCNRADGARRGNAARGRRRHPTTTTAATGRVTSLKW